ncbi:MAG: DUF4968 domain-containing protein [Succinivibrio sp.]|nr:DUF4968 domain-containing protein [Succinivibrio sp.]
MFIKALQSIESIPEGYLIKTESAYVKLVFMTEDIIRFRVSFDHRFQEQSYGLVHTCWADDFDEVLKDERTRSESLKVPYEDEGEDLVFTTSSLRLKLHKSPFYLRLYNQDNQLIYSDLKERAYDQDQLGRLTHYSLFDYQLDHCYGFGEKTGKLDKKGRHMRMAPKDAIGSDPEFGEPLYKHVPFYVRVSEQHLHALGLFYNNSHDAVFDMGNERSGYWDSYCYYQTDGGDLDLFLINGPTLTEVTQRYTFLTGTQAMPTKQSLGYTASTMYYTELDKDCDKEIYRVIRKYRQEQIPIDNFWLASGYTSGEQDNLRYTFNWNRRRFPDPEGFIQKMTEDGINVIPNLKPGVLEHHPYLEYYRQQDAFVKTPDGSQDYIGRWWGGAGRFVDFTSKKGRSAWQELLKKQILTKGIQTIWNDNCEFDGVEDRNAQVSADGCGGTMAGYKPLQANMMAYAGLKAFKEVYPNMRPYLISRAGFAGIQRYAQVWAGDNLTSWRTLKFNIATLVGMGISGMANCGADIGGFAGPAPEAELLLRWIQNGIFQPRFCINSANSDNTVTQPWMYPSMLPYIREAYQLRYHLMPYLYSLMRQSHVDGLPVMRALCAEFPEDLRSYSDEHYTFMFGPALLVANVVEKGASERRLYLPGGSRWFDLSRHFQAYEGGQEISCPVDLKSIPLFLREGAIIPSSHDFKDNATTPVRNLDLLIEGSKDCEFTLYDDDGCTQDYLRGAYSELKISVKAGARMQINFQHQGSYQTRLERMLLKVVSLKRSALYVAVNGEKLPQFLIEDDFKASSQGWFYANEENLIYIKYPALSSDYTVEVSSEKFDLIGMENNG